MPEFLWKWRRELIFSLLIIISLVLLVSQRQPGFFSLTLRQGVAFVIVPFQKASTAIIKRSRSLLSRTHSLKKLRWQNADLKRKVEKLSLRNMMLQEQARENETLRQELDYQKRTPWAFLPTEIIARDPVSWLERVVADRGSADDVEVGDGVISPLGIVGRIQNVGLYSSTVMLLLDAQSSVAGLVERSRINGTLKGTGAGYLKLKYVASDDDVRVGDRVVTSPLSSLFPPGLLIGEIASVAPADDGLMLDIQVKPVIQFKTLDRFLILRKED